MPDITGEFLSSTLRLMIKDQKDIFGDEYKGHPYLFSKTYGAIVISMGDHSSLSEFNEGTPIHVSAIDPEENGMMRSFVLYVLSEDTEQSFSQKIINTIKFVKDSNTLKIPANYLYKEYAKDPDYAKMKDDDPFLIYGK